tara:strand:- start:691 stop:1695 length:1005 start_codon:yes stop_codon:yes gene_type:complete
MVDVSKRAQEKSNLKCLSEKLKLKLAGLSEKERLRYAGYGNAKKIEPVPNFIKAGCEKVIKGENNTWITMGRDRPGSIATGYGGSGDSHAGAIDICVGRANKYARATDTECTDEKTDGLIVDGLVEDGKVPEELLRVNNDFLTDAARIYISQKTDVDYNFGICIGKQLSPRPRSAIALKADLLRFVARESVKIVTRSDDKNSQGGDVDVIGGIDIIAGNDDSDLQPMVKGNNLKELLTYIVNDINRITQHLHQQSLSYQALETIIMNHVHIDPATGVTGPSPEVMIGTALKSIQDVIVTYPTQITLLINGILEEWEYLKRTGAKSILSKKNNVN